MLRKIKRVHDSIDKRLRMPTLYSSDYCNTKYEYLHTNLKVNKKGNKPKLSNAIQPINPFLAYREKNTFDLDSNKSIFSPMCKVSSDEVLKISDIAKKKEELKIKNKKIQNKRKKDLQANKLSDIADLDDNFEFILKDDIT